jgi:hypothetical protein
MLKTAENLKGETALLIIEALCAEFHYFCGLQVWL